MDLQSLLWTNEYCALSLYSLRGIETTKAAEISGFLVLPQGVEPWTP